jgi:hypothetical protein
MEVGMGPQRKRRHRVADSVVCTIGIVRRVDWGIWMAGMSRLARPWEEYLAGAGFALVGSWEILIVYVQSRLEDRPFM